MASDDLDDARVLASLGRILTDGAPFSALPGVDPVTKLFPAPTVDAIRAPLEQAVTDIDESIATLEPAVASLDSLVTAGRLSESNLESTIGSEIEASPYIPKVVKQGSYITRLRQTRAQGDTLHPSPPTVSVILLTSSTMTNPIVHRVASRAFTVLGGALLTYDSNGVAVNHITGASGSYEAASWGAGFNTFNVSEIEMHFVLESTSGRFQVEIDGMPVTLLPVTYSGLTAFTNYVLKIAWAGPENHTVRIWGSRFRLGAIRAPRAGTITPLDNTLMKVAVVGASFAAQDFSGWPLHIRRRLGVDLYQAAVAGTGFINDGGASLPYGATVRLNALEDANPDLIILEASGNDSEAGTQAEIATAMTAYLDEVESRLPGVPIIFIACPPRGATVAAAAYTAKNLRASEDAVAATTANIIGYHDYIGAVDPISAYTTAASYSIGTRVTYLGAVYEAVATIASAPATFNPRDWKRFGVYTGTGNAGATAGDGTRDVLLDPDNLHPNPAGADALAQMYEADIRADIATLSAL